MKNKFLILLAFASVASLFSNCTTTDKNMGNTAQLNFTANYSGQPLVMLQPVTYQSKPLKFTRSAFYLSNTRLIKTDGSEVNVLPTSFVDLSFSDINAAAAGQNLTLKNIPSGEYKGLRFGIGVGSGENAKTPADFGGDNPLSETAEYWSSWRSYIFSKTEGQFSSNNGVVYFAYHTGADRFYREVTLNKNFSINDSNQKLAVQFDVNKILENATENVDITLHQTAHSTQDTVVSVFITKQYQSAFSLK